MIVCADPFVGRRLRARRVDEEGLAQRTAARAIERKDWYIDVEHGGSVCNSYGYKADTECALAVSDPFGNVVFWTGRASANKVTYRSAANVCFPNAGELFDDRVKNEVRLEVVRTALMEAHSQEIPAMMVIAAAAASK